MIVIISTSYLLNTKYTPTEVIQKNIFIFYSSLFRVEMNKIQKNIFNQG